MPQVGKPRLLNGPIEGEPSAKAYVLVACQAGQFCISSSPGLDCRVEALQNWARGNAENFCSLGLSGDRFNLLHE